MTVQADNLPELDAWLRTNEKLAIDEILARVHPVLGQLTPRRVRSKIRNLHELALASLRGGSGKLNSGDKWILCSNRA